MFFPNNVMLRRMSDRFNRDFQNNNLYTSYNAGTLIPSGNKGPPPPMMTQLDQNLQAKQVLHTRGQFSSEKDIVTNNPYP